MTYLINGHLINGQAKALIPIRDRGLAYGDGLFETIAIIEGMAHNWDLHFKRLFLGSKQLKIKIPEETTLFNGFKQLLVSTKKSTFIIKIIITRGEGGKGYQCPENTSSQWIMMVNSWPEYPASFYLKGINAQQSDFKLSVQPFLAGIKHLNRLEQVIAKQALADEYQEALLSNTDNFLIEGISSNLYFVENGLLCLPSLEQCGISGTIRTQILNLCAKLDIKFQIADFTIENIYNCDEIFYSNSIIGLWPVKNIDFCNRKNKTFQPGSIYRKLAKVINGQLARPLLIT